MTPRCLIASRQPPANHPHDLDLSSPALVPRKLTAALYCAGLLVATVGCATLLTACLGGGGDATPDSPPDSTPAVAADVQQTVKVIDGAIEGAIVCLDKNRNGACDAGETQGTTAADGSVTLTLPAADAGKYPVLALVGTDARDAVHGKVATAYVMKAPADAPALVTPLTTLVALQVEGSGTSTSDAVKAVQDKLGSNAPLMADFTGKADADSVFAASLARLVVSTVQQQSIAIASAKDSSGNALAKADLTRAIHDSVMAQLTGLAAAVAGPAVAQAAGAAAKESAIQATAAQAAAAAGLTATNVGSVVAVTKLPPAPEDTGTPTGGASLRWFSFSDAQNYNYRMFKSTDAQSVVVNGLRKFTEYREQSSGKGGAVGFYQQWGEGLNNWARNQVIWTGSEWFTCPTDFASDATPWDAAGQSTSYYCKGFKSFNKRTARDVSGMKMGDVVAAIRAYAGVDTAGKFSAWGPDPAANATALSGNFPAGSTVYYYNGADLVNPDAYNTNATDTVAVYRTTAAMGNATECAKVTGANFEQFRVRPASLEKMIAQSPGIPCVYGPVANSGNDGSTRNEWGSNSTLGIGDVPDAFVSSTGFYRSGVKNLRVSFADGNVANYWLCVYRSSDGSIRNCDAAGSGSYSIATQGDARVLRLTGTPAAGVGLGYTRSFIERDGRVWYGYRSKLTSTLQIRPNLTASNALFAALGMPTPRAALSTLTADDATTYYANKSGAGSFNRAGLAAMPNDPTGVVGAWAVNSATDPRAVTVLFFANGQYLLAEPAGDPVCGSAGLERGTYSWNSSSGALMALSNSLDTNGCGGFHDTTNASQPFSAPIIIKPTGDGKTVAVTFEDGSPGTLYRLSK